MKTDIGKNDQSDEFGNNFGSSFDRQLRLIFEQAPLSIARLSSTGDLVWGNSLCWWSLGYTREEFLSLKREQFTFRDDIGRTAEFFSQVSGQRGVSCSLEKRFVRKDGSLVWGKVNVAPIFNDDGTSDGFIAIIEDIDQWKAAEEELKASENRYRTIFTKSPAPILIMDAEGVIGCNESTIRLFGSQNMIDIAGKSLADLSPPSQPGGADSRIAIAREFDRALRKGFQVFDWVLRRSNGDDFFSEIKVTPFSFHGNRLFQVMISDITARKVAEIALRESESRYRELVNNANSIILRLDPEGRVVFFNDYAERFFHYNMEDVVGISAFDTIFRDPPEGKNIFRELVEAIPLQPERYSSVEFQNTLNDGRRVWISWTSRAAFDVRGKYNGVLCVGNDISALKKAEEERNAFQSQLAHSQKMEAIGTLAGGLAHDFNNVLGGILGSLNLLQMLLGKEELNSADKVERYLEIAVKSSNRAAEMIKRLLSLTRRHEVVLEPLDISVALANVEKLCQNSFPKSVALDFSDARSNIVVLADHTQIEQMVLNLCVNASHAVTLMRGEGQREGGTVRVETSLLISDWQLCIKHSGLVPGVELARISVIDDGVGMDEEVKRRLFEPFFTTKEKDRGSGLGLAMVYNIVQLHGGHVEVESEPGSGTSISLYIPVYSGEQVPVSSRGMDGSIVSGKGNILIVDDEEVLLNIASEILSNAGYTVITGEGGLKGLEIYRKQFAEIDAVVLDMSMPEISGIEVFEEMLKINPYVRVIFASGFMNDERLKKAMELGVCGFIQKPYTPHILSREIHRILSERSE